MRSDEAVRAAAGSVVVTGSELKMEHNKGSANTNNNSSSDNNTGNRPNFKGGSSNNNEVMKCPRCSSLNTKFCYYNNYSLTQPRYFCKSCRRYWTKGGTLRNVPVGGGCRKNKRVKLIRTSPSDHHPSSFPGLVGHDIVASAASAGFLNEHAPSPFLHSFSPSPFHENYPGLAFSDLQQSVRTPLSLMSQFVGIDGMDLYHPTSSAAMSGSLDSEEAANLLNPRSGGGGGAYPACKTDLSLFYEDSAVPQLQTSSALADYHMYTTRPPMSSSMTPTTANGSSPFHVIDSQLQMRHHKLTTQLMSEQRVSENGSSSHMQPLGGCKEESLEDQLERFKAKALLSHLMNTTTNPLQLGSSAGGAEQQWQEEQEQVNNGMLPEAGWANSVWPDYHSLTSFAAGTMQ